MCVEKSKYWYIYIYISDARSFSSESVSRYILYILVHSQYILEIRRVIPCARAECNRYKDDQPLERRPDVIIAAPMHTTCIYKYIDICIYSHVRE